MLPIHRHDVPLIGVLLVCAVFVRAAHPAEGNLLCGLHRHDHQIARLDPTAQCPQLARKVRDLAVGSAFEVSATTCATSSRVEYGLRSETSAPTPPEQPSFDSTRDVALPHLAK